jgi:hypothetical protein
VDGKEHGLEIETVDAEVDGLGQTQAAAVEEQNHQSVGKRKLSEDGFNFGAGARAWSKRR